MSNTISRQDESTVISADACCEPPSDGSNCCEPSSDLDLCCEQPTADVACCTPTPTTASIEFGERVGPLSITSDNVTLSNGGAKKTALPVAIIGGGPIGLVAAAHLHQRGEPFMVFEAGPSVAAGIKSWQHIRFFSPWRYSLDEVAVSMLAAHGWQAPPLDELPRGRDLIEQYLQPLADLPELKPHIQLNSRVTFVGRKGLDKMKTAGREARPFVLHITQGDQVKRVEARAVIDASGTWANPNPIGSGGIAAVGETKAQDHIFYGIPDVLGTQKSRYLGKRVLVVGGGDSAKNALLELTVLKNEDPTTEIYWALRKTQMKQVYGGELLDGLPARGALGSRTRELVESKTVNVLTPFFIHQVKQENGKLHIMGMLRELEATIPDIDEIVAATGARPDLSFLREVRASVDPALESVPDLAPLIDPNIHSCGTVRPHGEKELRQPEKDFYIVGMKSYGRAPTFLLATGYEQVRSVVAGLVGDWEAAAKVQLNLPETGVCSSDFELADGVAGACCGPAVSEVERLAVAGASSVSLEVIQPVSGNGACCG